MAHGPQAWDIAMETTDGPKHLSSTILVFNHLAQMSENYQE